MQLYNHPDYTYTLEGTQAEEEVYALLHPLVTTLQARGFTLEDINIILYNTVQDVMVTCRLDARIAYSNNQVQPKPELGPLRVLHPLNITDKDHPKSC